MDPNYNNQNQWNTQPTPDNQAAPNSQPYDQAEPIPEPVPESKGMSIASLILGIVSIVCCCFFTSGLTGLIGIILGAIGMKKAPSAKGMAIAGIIMSAVGIVLFIVYIILVLAGAISVDDYYYYYS